ncbi:restriction endonuclease [uncultured Shewanella sp.]|uniref:restriction endonuclease n=1 Tax=uncultured Shewanella sp. TaxID=173975 RepID=UPI002623868D|nr:restriction endonuclease [uncultured Shewanella sp.]
MNTVKVGDILENEVLKIFKQELESGKLGILADHAKVFQKKGYYSKDREKDIIVDISIELWPPGSSNYSLLFVIECKNLGKPVPVDDIEEFKAKLDQIGGKNTKGIVVARNSFQSGAQKYAKNQGIGLARAMPKNQVSWLMHMVTSNSLKSENDRILEVQEALTVDSYEAKNRDLFAFCNELTFESWRELIEYAITPITQ